MEKLGKQFVDGAYEKSGMPREAAHDLFENIKKFAGYAFNKSHSAAYAVITYQTAYLKYYYETEFMAALLSTEMRQQENVVKYIQSAREMGIPVLSPDVNQSDRDFSVVNVKLMMRQRGRGSSSVLVRSRASAIQPSSLFLRNATTMDTNRSLSSVRQPIPER